MSNEKIKVSSHVARDFLQSSASFNTLPKVLWEYVSNSLDNPKDDLPIVVAVDLIPTKPKSIQIADNGIGMSRDDLIRFFQMHGENLKRKKGKRVRGKFGTGKSAAFGIANTLRIDTVNKGVRNVVQLTRESIENAAHGEDFPVDILVENQQVESEERKDGTIIHICNLNLSKINFDTAINYIERNLGRYKSRATVIINGHPCEFHEPSSVDKYRISSPKELWGKIGKVELIIKVSPQPLEKEFNGIVILSYGIWHETTLEGIENKKCSNLIFGEVDVPFLEDYEGPFPTFDNARNNQLNRANPHVIILLSWIGSELEKVREDLVEKENERKRTERYKKLSEKAKELENILNEDFEDILRQFELAKRVSKRQSTKLPIENGELGEIIAGIGDKESDSQETGPPRGDGKKGKEPPGEGATPRPFGPNLSNGSQSGSSEKIADEKRRKTRGIFTIEWIEGNPEDNRSSYDKNSRTIYINLNHPQVMSALKASGGPVESKQFNEIVGGSVETKQFNEIVYEIAVVEYALGVQYERIENEKEIDPFDALFEIGRIINRLTRKIDQFSKG